MKQIFRRWDMPHFALPLLLMFKNVLIPRQNRENGVPDGEIFVNMFGLNITMSFGDIFINSIFSF
jgi:hypothetical protein